jgi:lipopolysaccharide/colanic/teichoic acid biosynthesis glycosyltransferase
MSNFLKRTIKRTMDIVGGTLLVLALSPILLAAAVAIVLTDGFPIL